MNELPTAAGPFEGTVESLGRFRCPEWFRDAKFGIWAHWGPQAVPGLGDWFARHIYEEGAPVYKAHLERYGHPSRTGYKDIIPLWKAEKWEPGRLMELYKAAGAHYFVAQAVHHDNFDNWDSKYQKWNSVNMGPHRDVVGEWQQAARRLGLPFGVSEHLGHSFTFMQASHGSDKEGPLAGVPYDGADPAYSDLYQSPAKPGDGEWYCSDPAWARQWHARIHDLVSRYEPDLLYTDGGTPFGAAGLAIQAHLYNLSIRRNAGRQEAVYCCKKDYKDTDFHDGTCVQDVERGGMTDIQPLPWQTDTSNGDWYYDERDRYKSAAAVVHNLLDTVSKNGNLLLNVVLHPDGSLPPESEALLREMAGWMKVNAEAVFGTRPWALYGEGPTAIRGGAFDEDYAFTAQDIRFTRKGDDIYAFTLGLPAEPVSIRALASGSPLVAGEAARVTLLGYDGELEWTRTSGALAIQTPAASPCRLACCFRISGLTTIG